MLGVSKDKLVFYFSKLFKDISCNENFIFFINHLRNDDVLRYYHFTTTGNIRMITSGGDIHSIVLKRALRMVSANFNATEVKNIREMYLLGTLNYTEFCYKMADAGCYRWIVDFEKTTIRYESINPELYIEFNIPVDVYDVPSSI